MVIGNSLTASSAVIAATDAPDRVSSLVLIGPFVRNVPMPAWQRLLFRAMLAPPWGRSAWLGYYRKQMYPLAPPPDHADYVATLGSNLEEAGRFKAFRSLAFNSHADSASRLDRVAVPALIVMGTADPDFPDPTAEGQWIAGRLRGSLTLVEGAGHYPHAEAPDVVGGAIIDFLGR